MRRTGYIGGRLRALCLGLVTGAIALLYAVAIAAPGYAQEAPSDLSIYQIVSHYVTLPMGATSAPAGTPQQGNRNWNVFLNNDSQTAVTNASVTVNSGYDASLFRWGSFDSLASFPQTKTMATLQPGQQWEPSTISSDIPVNFTLGYDSTRTLSPATIPAGGGQQTVTVTFRPVDPRFTPGPHVCTNIVLESEIPGVTVASATNPANLDQGELLNTIDDSFGLYQWQLCQLQLNKQYTFTATLNVPNSTGAALDYQPAVNIRDESAVEVLGAYTGPSVSLPEPTLDGNAPGSGQVTYAVAETDRTWTAKRAESWDVIYPGTPKPPEVMQAGIIVNPGTGDPALVMPYVGFVMVIVPSTETLDASMIGSVRFGTTGTEAPPLVKALWDINHDGRKDLVMLFRTSDTGITRKTNRVVLTGKFAMTDIRGEAAIRTSYK